MCGSSYTETITGNAKSSVSIRSCMASTECNYKGSFSTKYGHIRVATSCCTTDLCTPTIPQLPPISSNPNGLVCPSCISDDPAWCDTSDTIQCTGDENSCLLQTTKITGPYPYSAATGGCATSSLCNFRIGPLNVGGVKFTCTSGGFGVHKVVLTPVIVCLLLLKFFF
ncbi:phospholipase A2 inhibitor and Ly6/PLAUR domain-containing protein-like [Leptodactylus fuscus]|uniref:phospholipase A2 inhibitor and Ly6/PLAUR domain-containing protein-like n=1 Tax=Leptodactylus fuscus TaxID=238119 RepID=UPI003F4E8314